MLEYTFEDELELMERECWFYDCHSEDVEKCDACEGLWCNDHNEHFCCICDGETDYTCFCDVQPVEKWGDE